jgi:hypothetical protein
MSVFAQSARFAEGIDGCASGANDQKARCSAVMTLSALFDDAAFVFAFATAAGQGAPDLIQAASAAIWASPSLGSLRGIFGAPPA